MNIVVTGGCGFIGSALVRRLLRDKHRVANIDRLTYAGDPREGVWELRKRNGLDSTTIAPGQVLVVPT